CGSRARCCPSARRRRASQCRRRAGAKGRSFEHPDAIAQLGSELEVFVFHGAPQLLLELEQLQARVGRAGGAGRRIALPDVLAGAVQAAQQGFEMRGASALAVVAHHQGIASTEPTAARRPSSSIMIRSARPAICRLCVTTTTAVSYSRVRRKNTSCNRSELA